MNFVILPGQGDGLNSIRKMSIWLGKLVQFSLPLPFLMLMRPTRPSAPLAFPRWKNLLWGVSFGVLVSVAFITLYYGFLQEHPVAMAFSKKLYAYLAESDLASPPGFLTLGLFTAIVHSFLEEYYWRWFVFGRMEKYFPLWTAIILSSLGFMSYHVVLLWHYFPNQLFTVVVPGSLAVAIGGVFWAWLYNRDKSLSSVWISHLLVDGAMVYVEYQMLTSLW